MEIHQIRYFLAVCQHLNFRRQGIANARKTTAPTPGHHTHHQGETAQRQETDLPLVIGRFGASVRDRFADVRGQTEGIWIYQAKETEDANGSSWSSTRLAPERARGHAVLEPTKVVLSSEFDDQ